MNVQRRRRLHRLAASAAFIESYEAAHGAITDEEMRRAARNARSRAVTVRGTSQKRARAR